MQVNAIIIVRPDFAVQVLDQFRWFLVQPDHQIHEVETGKNPVTFGYVPTETKAAALLSPDESVFGNHLGPDVLESNGRFVDGNAVEFPQLIGHVGSCHRFYYWASFLADIEQIKDQ